MSRLARTGRTAALIAAVVAIHAGAAGSFAGAARQPDAPLPDREALFNATRDHLARSQQEQVHYAYKERRTELHTNPFGRLGTDGTVTYEVRPGPERGVTFRRVLERDGKPIADSPEERQERRPRPQARSPVEDVVDTLQFEIAGREMIDGRQAIAVRFSARPNAKPRTREGKAAQSFTGRIWVDEAAQEVMRVEATAIDDLSYGFGFVARLNDGATVRLDRQRVDADVWLPTALRFKGEGRALLFRKLAIDFNVEWFDYRRVE